jgi:hypothetical protein
MHRYQFITSFIPKAGLGYICNRCTEISELFRVAEGRRGPASGLYGVNAQSHGKAVLKVLFDLNVFNTAQEMYSDSYREQKLRKQTILQTAR